MVMVAISVIGILSSWGYLGWVHCRSKDVRTKEMKHVAMLSVCLLVYSLVEHFIWTDVLPP